jgi:hypothetical protein
MPAAKKPVRKAGRTTRQSAKGPTKARAQRTMSAAHKKALAEGRAMSLTVDRYLAVVNTPKRRGRKVSKSTLEQRLASARARVKAATGIDKVLAAQEIRDIEAKIAQLAATSGTDLKSLEAAFVKIAKKFGENRGIGYAAWRDAGVPAQVLRRAGVARTRG